MDTRLLRVWSNWLCLSRPALGHFVCLIALLSILGRTHEGWAQAGQEPLSQIRLTWNPAARKFIGVQYLALPQGWFVLPAAKNGSAILPDSAGLDFWLLPNRDLIESTQQRLTREQREFKAAAPTIEWPFADVGLGVLSVREFLSAGSTAPCPATQELFSNEVERLTWGSKAFEKHDSERHLRLELGVTAKTKCSYLRIKFDFEPRPGEGNFALKNEGNSHFSGPIFPLLKNEPVASRIVFQPLRSKVAMSCADCRTTDERETFVDFYGLPPALHFLPEGRASEDVLKVSGVALGAGSLKAGKSGEEEIIRGVQLFHEALKGAIVRAKNESERDWQVLLRRNVLLERLVLEQVGEIQLHSSYGNVSPLLTSYHRAALFRALARDFLRSVLGGKRINDWNVHGENEIVARVLAEMWLQAAFPSLNNLRELSDRLDFLPFFRAIQRGNAFLNNSVFVGAEERTGDLDFSVYHEFFSPRSGADLILRLKSCAEPNDFGVLQKLAEEVARGTVSVHEFSNRLRSMKPIAQCLTPMRVGLLPDFFPEEEVQIVEDRKNLVLKRKVVDPPQTFEFFFSRNRKLPRENLRVTVVDAKEGRKELVLSAQDTKEEKVSLAASVQAVQVVAPHPAVSSDRLLWPRSLRTVLQALSLNYDSRRTDLVLRSQLQTTQTGDEWGRALLLGYRREFSDNNIDLQFSTRLPSLVPEASASLTIAGTTRIQSAPPTFVATSYAVERGRGSVLYPEGVGLRLWLRRPLSLSALNEKLTDPAQEWIFSFNTGLAPRLTWSEVISYGSSETDVDVGLRSVPAWPTAEYTSKEYALVRSELRHTLTQNLNATLARSLLFQHAVLYGAHVFAFDRLRAESSAEVDARVAQSLLMGFRLYGALFGAKDQAVSLEIARALTDPARTSFGFSLGKALN
ncbi:MAG: hypothetical protein FJY29_08885 [Betaproteobacteria bacterium]|nr:hypothetical protein [Betaproteobacteria bacterium]